MNLVDMRLRWGNPRATADICLYFLTAMFLFMNLDPALILTLTLFTFGFLEGWNPFGFGTLSDMLRNLFVL